MLLALAALSCVHRTFSWCLPSIEKRMSINWRDWSASRAIFFDATHVIPFLSCQALACQVCSKAEQAAAAEVEGGGVLRDAVHTTGYSGRVNSLLLKFCKEAIGC